MTVNIVDGDFDRKSILLRVCLGGRIAPLCLVAFAVTTVAFEAFASKDGNKRWCRAPSWVVFSEGVFVRFFLCYSCDDGFILSYLFV